MRPLSIAYPEIKEKPGQYYVFDPEHESTDILVNECDGGYVDAGGLSRDTATWFPSLDAAKAACVKAGREFVVEPTASELAQIILDSEE